MTTNTTNTTKTTATRKDFETLKRDFEQGIASGTDYTPELINLSTAIAAACLNKCIDPQRKTAGQREAVSDNGLSPALVSLRRGLYHDVHHLDNLHTAADKATRMTYTQDGDLAQEVIDPAALAAVGELIGETLSDGLDLVHTAAVALLEQAAAHADPAAPWLDTPYTVRRLARKVYIQSGDSAAYRDEDTTPVQEVYRAVRRAIQSSAAVQTDPRNGYTYIDMTTPDGLEVVYLRLSKWADLGGHDRNGHYTADPATVDTYEKTLAALNLSDRQLTVINLRMRGYGKKAIGTYLGIDPNNVGRVLRQVQAKAEKIGFTPAMWAEMTAEN